MSNINPNTAKAQKILEDIKYHMVLSPNQAFITNVALALNWNITEGLQDRNGQSTVCATDGINVFFNPDELVNKSKTDIEFLLYQQIWHVCFNHHERISDTSIDADKWNEAGNLVINAQMVIDSEMLIPEDGSAGEFDRQYHNMSTYDVYKTLMAKPPSPPQPQSGGGEGDGSGKDEGDGSGSGSGNNLLPSPGDTDVEQMANQQQQKETVLAAAAAAKMAGSTDVGHLPGNLEALLEELSNPKLDWRVILQNYMASYAKNDYSFKMPNKRFFPDFYLPSLFSEAMGEIAVAIDTSGSVSDEEFTSFISEINDIQTHLNPTKLTVIDFDTKVNNKYELVEQDDITDLKFTGRGGTALEPVFELYKKEGPKVLIVFSDLYCNQIQKDPGYDVIWIVVNNPSAQVNFGTMIHIET